MFESLEMFGDRTCLMLEGGTRLSYHELVGLSDDFSGRLGKERKLVLLEASNNLAGIAAIVACFRSRQPFILCSDATRSRIEASFHPDVTVDSAGHITSYAEHSTHRLHPDLAILLSTSGSTGATKLVRLSESAIAGNAGAIAEYLQIDTGTRAITSLPISYSYGLSILTSHLSVGASLALTEKSVTDEKFWDLFAALEVTSLAGVPYTYELLEAVGFRDRVLPSLRCMTQAGGRLAPELVRRYAKWSLGRGVRFYTMYGQTEAAPRMAYLAPELALSHADCIGRAIPGGQLRLVGPAGRPVKRGATGELVYLGPNVMMGYAHEPQDLARGPELTELHTGDLAQEVAEGLFKIVGRSSRISKIAGLRIDLDDVERLLKDQGHDAVVTGDDAVMAVAIAGDAAGIAAVGALIDRHTSIAIQSRVIFRLPDIPRLPSGKIDYQGVLAAGIEKHRAEAASRAARLHPTESFTAEFAQVLHLNTVDGRESFSSLGGDSLSYIELSLAIERKVGHIPAGWEHLTVEQLDALPARDDRPAEAPAPRMSTEIALRAGAIAFIVAHHTLLMDLGGGLEALLLLLGVNLARSQTWQLVASSPAKLIGDVGKRLLVPYYGILFCFALWHHDHVPWSLWFLFGNWSPAQGSLIYYWFVSAYVQILLIIHALAGIGPLRRFMLERPEAFAVLFLLAALAVKVGALATFQHFAFHGATPDQFIYIVALGWCLQTAKTVAARVALIAVTLCIAVVDWSGVASGVWSGFDGRWRDECLLASVIALALVKSVRVTRLVRKTATSIAVASLMIYLTHPLLLALTADWFSPPRKADPLCYAAIVCFLAFGVVAYRAAAFCRHRGLRVAKWFGAYLRVRKRVAARKRVTA